MNRVGVTRVEITTPARLHFGLLDVRPPFGGCGVMVEKPCTRLRATRHSDILIDPRLQSRWKQLLPALTHAVDHPVEALRLDLIANPPAHNGLGSGTQLSLAMVEAVWILLGGTPDVDQLVRVAERSRRSAVGSIGYRRGNFVVEGLSGPGESRGDWALPEPWCVTLVLPEPDAEDSVETVSGNAEQTHFDALPSATTSQREEMERWIRHEMLPAIDRHDFQQFTDAVQTYNRLSGQLFAPVQGGPYRSLSRQWIEQLAAHDCRGFGQSSWGPGVFAWHACQADAEHCISAWDVPGSRMMMTKPARSGRHLEITIDEG